MIRAAAIALAFYGGCSLILDLYRLAETFLDGMHAGHNLALDAADVRGTADHPRHVLPGQGDL